MKVRKYSQLLIPNSLIMEPECSNPTGAALLTRQSAKVTVGKIDLSNNRKLFAT